MGGTPSVEFTSVFALSFPRNNEEVESFAST